jgi:hypothetical protein
VAQVVEPLPSQCEALSSNISTKKKKKVAFLYTNNKQAKKEIKKTNSLTKASKILNTYE